MDPITLAAISSIASLAGGALGGMAQNQANADVNRMIREQLKQLESIPIPDEDKLKIALNRVSSAGNLTPQQEQALTLAGRDAMQDISIDPRLKQTQMQQLEQLQKLGTMGVTPEERAQLNTIQRQVASDQASRLKGMLEEQTRRGVGTSDAALAQRMLAEQAGSNVEAEQADRLAATGFQRALQAMSSAGGLAGQMSQQEYAQKAALAQALNAREMANQQIRAGVQTRNVGALNEAQRFNLANQQDVINRNAAIQAQEAMHNAGVPMQIYNARMGKFGAAQSLHQAQMQQRAAQGKAQAGMYSGIASGISGYLGSKGGQDAFKSLMDKFKNPEQTQQDVYVGDAGNAIDYSDANTKVT